MVRIKRGKIKTKKRKKILKLAKGYKWGRKSKEKFAKEAILHAGVKSYRGRKEKKRNFRRLWQVQINAFLRSRGLKYSTFINQLKENNIELDRKILADLANNYPRVLDNIIEELNLKN
ncbi:MAG: 50S ribosomal protein L20 [Candidatus Parcubacteria bacterium]|nr:MAG: 50S ribosomal protein L20 [Candidatus Parcubacteria bacterium]